MSSVLLVTGGGGFVGSAIVRRLVRERAALGNSVQVDHVVALLRPGGSAERLSLLPRSGWSTERADITDSESFQDVLDRVRPSAIIHAALDRRMYHQDDRRLVRRPLELMLRSLAGAEGSLYVQAGSAWVLASGTSLDESAPLAPFGPYARNKAAEETLLGELAGEAGVPWMNLRLFNVFGRYEKPDRLLPTLVSSLSHKKTVELSHGEQLRDFNDVDVVAGAFVHCLGAPRDAYDATYNIGSGRATTVRELASIVAELTGGSDLLRFGAADTPDQGVPALVADPSRARAVLGWDADLDLEARVSEAVAWWLARLGSRIDVA